jgi:hypothetical protein
MDLHLNPIERLLLACANPAASPEILTNCTNSSIDWKAFADMAANHRLLPLIHSHCEKAKSTAIPNTLAAASLRAYTANAVRMEFLSAHLNSASTTLTKAGVRFVAWKGPDLAMRTYADIALRPSDDLDFLVHPDDMLKSITALSSSGFQPKLKIKDSTLPRYLRAGFEYIMVSNDSDLCLELSTRPVPPPSPLNGNLRDIWESDDGYLIHERYFLYLCMHGARHCWNRLIWVTDLCAFITMHPDLSWQGLAQLAKDCRAETMLLSAIDMMKCAGFTAPELDLHARRIPAATLVRNAIHSEGISTYAEAKRRSSMHSRLKDRICYLARWLLAPTFSDWEAINLPSGLECLYWVIRPLRIVRAKLRGI